MQALTLELKNMIGIAAADDSTLGVLVYQALKQYSSSALLPLLSDPSNTVRSAAARETQMRGEIDTLHYCVQLLKGASAREREIAAFVLGQLGTPKLPYKSASIPLLEQCLMTDRSITVIATAIAALGHLRSTASIQLIISFARHNSSTVRESVAASLGHFLNNDAATKTLRRLSRDSNPSVRDWARYNLNRSP